MEVSAQTLAELSDAIQAAIEAMPAPVRATLEVVRVVIQVGSTEIIVHGKPQRAPELSVQFNVTGDHVAIGRALAREPFAPNTPLGRRCGVGF